MEMEIAPPETKRMVRMGQLTGAVFALTVMLPAMYLPRFLERPPPGSRLPVSAWILLPAIGTAICTQLLFDQLTLSRRHRLRAGIFGFATGCSCYLTAAWWAWGGAHTSRLEIMLVTLLGGLPVYLLFLAWRCFRNPMEGAKSLAAGKSVFWKRMEAQRGFPGRLVLITTVAFVALTFMTISDLNQLERQGTPAKFTWAPALSIYDRFGYWPAVLLTPTLGLALVGYFIWVNRRKPKPPDPGTPGS